VICAEKRILISPENFSAIAPLFEAKLCCWDNDVYYVDLRTFPDGPKTPVCSAQFVRVFISRFQVDFQPGIAGCDERSRLSPKTKMPRTSKMQNAGWRNTTGSITLWLFNIAMENGPFIDGLPIRNGDFPWLC